MKKIALFIALIIHYAGFTQQTYKVSYNLHSFDKKYNFHNTVKTYLTGDGKISLYEEDYINQNSNAQENNLSIKATKNPTYYKNLSQRTIVYDDHIRMKPFEIKDSVPDFGWKIENEKKTILGYNCQKATTFFRGRNYEAYFTTEIPYQDGPWKFFGLPGMILELKSSASDATYDIIAETIEIKNGNVKIENPHLNKKVIDYAEFVSIYKNKYKESVANEIQNPGSFVLPKGYQEIYITE